ncbi:hypothetical protein ACVWZM_001698 [Bradyrhizobium sp. USDA 4501]
MLVADLNAGSGMGKINDFELARRLLLHGVILIAPEATREID